MLVHGEAAKMEFLKQKIIRHQLLHAGQWGDCYRGNTPLHSFDMSGLLFKRTLEQCYGRSTITIAVATVADYV